VSGGSKRFHEVPSGLWALQEGASILTIRDWVCFFSLSLSLSLFSVLLSLSQVGGWWLLII
jgi:hypothetical protein